MKTQEHYTKIPTLDIGPYLNGDAGALEDLAAKVAHIQENIGFLMLVNHGLDLATLNAVYDKLKAFFALPMEVKLKYRINELSLGYIPPKSTMYVSSKINKNTKKDLNETLTLALERPSDHPWVKDKMRFVGPNQWPAEIEGLQETICAYQREVLKLGRKILPIYAVALDQAPDFFDEFFTDPVMWSRNAHYPAVEAEDNQFGMVPKAFEKPLYLPQFFIALPHKRDLFYRHLRPLFFNHAVSAFTQGAIKLDHFLIFILHHPARKPQTCPHFGQQHFKINRLCQIIICSRQNAVDDILAIRQGRQKKKGHCGELRVFRAHFTDEFMAAHSRHCNIADDQIRLMLQDHLKTLHTILGNQCLIAGMIQHFL